MTAIAHTRRLSTVRSLDVATFNQKLEEMNVILREIQTQVSEARGVSGPENLTLNRHLDMQGKRLQGVGPTRSETDVPNVRELRKHSLYAKDGVHEAYQPIVARAGIRTLTPAIAPNDLITLAQARKVVQAELALRGVSARALAATGPGIVSSADQAWAFPQAAVTLVNGLTSDWEIPARVYLRITGPTAAFSIGGMQPVADGRYLILHNATVQEMTLVNEDAATPATHRIQTGSGGNLTMSGLGVTALLYSALDQRWVTL